MSNYSSKSNLASYQDNSISHDNYNDNIYSNNTNILRPDIHAELTRLLGNQDFNNFNHTLADIESVSICYMTEKERYEQLKMMLDEDYYRLKQSNAKYDPCLETEILLRRAERGVDRKRMMHKYLRSKSVGVKSVGSQTHELLNEKSLFSNQSLPHDKRLTSAKSVDRLDHSILELTSVINNSTVVSGRTIKNNPKEKFSVKINLPSGSSDNEDNDSSIYSNSNISYTQPAKLNTDYYYYPRLASTVITPNTSINLPNQHQNISLRDRSVSGSSINSPRDYSQDNKYQLNTSASSQVKPFLLECNEVEKFDLYESIKQSPVDHKISTNPTKPVLAFTDNFVVNRLPSNSSNVSSPLALSPGNKYQTLQQLVLPSSNLLTNNTESVQNSNTSVDINSPAKKNEFGYDFKKNLLKNKKDVIDIDFDSYERREQKSLSPQPRPVIQQKQQQLSNKTTANYNQFVGRPQQRQQPPPPIAPRPSSRIPSYSIPGTREKQENVFRFDDAAVSEKENRKTASKHTNLNSRLYFQPNKGDKIDIDLSIYDQQSNIISKNNNNYSNSTSTSSLYNKKNNISNDQNNIEDNKLESREDEIDSIPTTRQYIFHEFLKSTSETVKIVKNNNIPQQISIHNKKDNTDFENHIQAKKLQNQLSLDESKQNIKLQENEMVKYNKFNNTNDHEAKTKVTGYSTTTNLQNKNKNFSKNFQTLEIKKESKLVSNDLNSSNIEVSGRDPSTKIRPIDSASISSKENMLNLNDSQSTLGSTVSESDSQYKLKILKIMKETSEREYEHLKLRIEKTRQRIPEIYHELETASGKKRFKLEKELDVLIKRLRMDKYKLNQYKILNEKKNDDTGSLNNKLIHLESFRNLSRSSMEKYEFSSSSESLSKNLILSKKHSFKSNLKKTNQDIINIPQTPAKNQIYQVFWCGMPEYNLNKKSSDEIPKEDFYFRPYGAQFNEPGLNQLIDQDKLHDDKNLIHISIDEIFEKMIDKSYFEKMPKLKESSIKDDLTLILKQDSNKNKYKCKDDDLIFNQDDSSLFADFYQNILNSSSLCNSKMNDSFLFVPDTRFSASLISAANQNTSSRNQTFIDENSNNEYDFFRFNNRYNYFGGSYQSSGRSVPAGSTSSNQDQMRPRMSTFGSNNSTRSNPSTLSYNSRSNVQQLSNINNNLIPAGTRSNLSSRSNQSLSISNENDGNIRKKTFLEIDYIEEDDLNQLNLANFEIIEDKQNNETLLVDINNPNQQSVILLRGWIESEESPYIAEENVDLSNLEIFEDIHSKRRYVVDQSTGKRYYIVSLEKMKTKRNNLLRLNKRVDSMEKIDDSEQVIHFKYNENDSDENEQFLGYVEEDDLRDFDMGEDAVIFEDPNNKEIYIAHKDLPNKRWAVLPQNWQIEETSPYLDEEDVEEAKFDIYVDSYTNRKFIIDEKTGQRYYLIPQMANNFKSDWLKILNTINARQQQVPTANHTKGSIRNNILTNPNPQISRSRTASETERNYSKQNEPFQLKDKNDPNQQRNINLNIKQSGRPGHLIKNDPDANANRVVPKPIIKPSNYESRPNIYDSRASASRSLSNDRYSEPSRSASSSKSPKRNEKNKKNNILNKPSDQSTNRRPNSKSPYRLNNVKAISKQQQQMTKMKQEQARRVFFAQRLPNMDRLWLHQLLIQQVNREKRIDARRPSRPVDNVIDESTGRHWRSLNDLNDPTLIDGQLDRDRLADIQVNGYDKYDKKRRNRNYLDREDGKSDGSYYNYKQSMRKNDKSEIGFGGDNPGFIRGVLTEQFQDYTEYVPMRITRNHRALVPIPRKYLRRQFLLTPRYLKNEWKEAIDQNYKMKPTMILIDDDERIISANKHCNVYVQFVHDNDAVTGADRAYQLMLPDRGPTSPTRPLMIKQKRQNKLLRQNPLLRPDLALREAPVFVNHNDGTSYFENIAQYLSQNFAKLSPKTVRTILQFADSKEFEQYLASKITREQAKKIADESGESLINLDSVKTNLLNLVNDKPVGDEPLYYHQNCEYDPLRNLNENQQAKELPSNLNETKEYEIGGKKIKSTFVGFTPSGELERLSMEDLPQNILDALKKADQKLKTNKK